LCFVSHHLSIVPTLIVVDISADKRYEQRNKQKTSEIEFSRMGLGPQP